MSVGLVAAACDTPFGLDGWPLAVVLIAALAALAYVLGRWVR